LGLCSCGGVRVWSKEAGLGKLAKCNNLPESDKGWQRFKKPAAVGLHGFKPHPPHYSYKVRFAQFSLVLSAGWQKIDFKLWEAFDFTLAFRTVKLSALTLTF